MPSWVAEGEPLRRIKHALSNWAGSGWVEWDGQPRIDEWLARNVDRAKYGNPKEAIARLLHELVNCRGCEVRAQKNPADGSYDADVWYSAMVLIDGREVFVKFIIHPDEPKEPGILIVSIHWQTP